MCISDTKEDCWLCTLSSGWFLGRANATLQSKSGDDQVIYDNKNLFTSCLSSDLLADNTDFNFIFSSVRELSSSLIYNKTIHSYLPCKYLTRLDLIRSDIPQPSRDRVFSGKFRQIISDIAYWDTQYQRFIARVHPVCIESLVNLSLEWSQIQYANIHLCKLNGVALRGEWMSMRCQWAV